MSQPDFQGFRDRLGNITEELLKLVAECEQSAKIRGLDVTTVLEFSKVISSADLDIYSLESLAINTLKGRLMVDNVRFLRQAIFSPGTIAEKPSVKDEGKTPFSFELDDPFIRNLKSNQRLVYVDRPDNGIPEALKERFERENIPIVIPLLPSEDKIIGLLLVGKRLQGGELNLEDEEMMKGLSDILAIALSNAYRYKQHERRIEELEEELKKKN